MISVRSRPGRFPGSGRARGRTAPLVLLLALWAYGPLGSALGAPVGAAGSTATQPPARNRAPQSSLGEITIQGLRQRHALGAAVDHFVFSTLVSLGHDPYARWDSAVCPLVAGLTREQGDFILARITQAALAAHVPLAGSRCRANLFVVVTDRPRRLLSKWWARDQVMYDTRNGIAPVRAFIASTRPVHAWYNTALGCSSQPLDTAAPANALAAAGMLIEGGSGVVCAHGVDTLLKTATVRGFSSVIVVVDAKQMRGVTLGQLAAYVTLTGLAEVNLSARDGAIPTILQLFRGGIHPPLDLTAWDRALLYGLYNTHQASMLQATEINGAVLKAIER